MGRHPQYTYVWRPAPPPRTTRRRIRVFVMEWFPVLAAIALALAILGMLLEARS